MSLLIAAKMFTTGRIIFAILFAVAFIAIMILSYKKDKENHKKHYQDSAKKVLIYGSIIVLVFMAIRYFSGH
ncbi:hypothetical protein OD91_1157 [Lutibacter sp. Hel_I_33_5]|uniref:hypothetical protein n=1 Tax=Lutibacter sp. Hel_I_33_5 TaxID=1566289 RepID=UPI0011AD4898|nr:hypothetical protein [Lutibacter sp. Hel_I_33_5]TVZ55884.1 hypothetical protein OD91_1157 [Lutibacter sp. Hel_I_33_5]